MALATFQALSVGAQSIVPAPSLDELLARAARQGTVRIIVELRVDGPAPPSGEAIARAQDSVLQELAGTGHRVLRRFTTIPFMGIEAGPDALRRLAASAQVTGVREDMILRPQGATGSP